MPPAETEALCVGATFDTAEAVKQAVKEFEEFNYVKLFVRDSRTIGAAVKAGKASQTTNFSEILKYFSITYACIHGGRPFKSMSHGVRPKTSTYRKGCPMVLKLGVTKDGQKLVVKEFNSEHNHEVNEQSFKHLVHNRKLDKADEAEVRNALSLHADKRTLQQQIMKKTGKMVTQKYLHNLSYDTKKKQEQLVARKLKTSFYMQDHVSRVPNSHPEVDTGPDRFQTVVPKQRELTPDQKYEESLQKAQEVACAIYCLPIQHYRAALGSLKRLGEMYSRGEDAFICGARSLTTERVELAQPDVSRSVSADGDAAGTTRGGGTAGGSAAGRGAAGGSAAGGSAAGGSAAGGSAAGGSAAETERAVLSVGSFMELGNETVAVGETPPAEKEIFYVGATFCSADALKRAVSSFENRHFVKLFVRDSRTIAAAVKSCRVSLTNKINEALKNVSMTYACIHGGRVHKSVSRGLRPKTSTYRKGCPMVLKLGVTKDCQKLVVKEFNSEHNHEVNEENFRSLVHNRKLDKADEAEVRSALSLHADKKILQQQIMEKTGKMVTKKDLRNLSYDTKKKQEQLVSHTLKTSIYMQDRRTCVQDNHSEIDTGQVVLQTAVVPKRREPTQDQKYVESHQKAQELAAVIALLPMPNYLAALGNLKTLKEIYTRGDDVVICATRSVAMDGAGLAQPDVSRSVGADGDVADTTHRGYGAGGSAEETERAVLSVGSFVVLGNEIDQPRKGELMLPTTIKRMRRPEKAGSALKRKKNPEKCATKKKIPKRAAALSADELAILGITDQVINEKCGEAQVRKRAQPLPFSNMQLAQKKEVILSHLVGTNRAKEALKGRIVAGDELELEPSLVSTFLVDWKVDTSLVRQYLTGHAWLLLQSVLEKKRETPGWRCCLCLSDENAADESKWTQCDRCLEWVHLQCIDVGRELGARIVWFCDRCCEMT